MSGSNNGTLSNHTNGDPSAEKHIPLAKSIAVRFISKTEDVENSDAYGNALLALVEAAKTWVPSMGTCFSTYATRCIINALISARRKEICRRLPEQLVPDELLAATPAHPELDPDILATLIEPPIDPSEMKDHQILLERFLDNKSYIELGKSRKVSAMAAWNAVRRAIARIRRDNAQLLASDSIAWELPE